MLIKCENASFGYEGKKIISDLSFEINEGEYVCMVGDNGSGKSTLLKGILGLISPLRGSVVYSEALKDHVIGYLPQQSGLQGGFPATVWEVVLSGTLATKKNKFFYSHADKEKAYTQIKKLEISNLLRKNFAELSGGQQQRVLIARALCASDRMLILDEPVTGLDPTAAHELYELLEIQNKKHGTAILMVTHDVENALDYADKILHIGIDGFFFGDRRDYSWN